MRSESDRPRAAPPPPESRITSYNVCYTKLLRLQQITAPLLLSLKTVGCSSALFLLLGIPVAYWLSKENLKFRWLLDRITSYNVCYTKLLRVGLGCCYVAGLAGVFIISLDLWRIFHHCTVILISVIFCLSLNNWDQVQGWHHNIQPAPTVEIDIN